MSFKGGYWFAPKTDLTYAFLNFPTDDLTEAEVRQEIAKAFKLWSDASRLTFTESTKTEGPDQADIRIGFYRGAHSDGHPFDGPGKVGSHSFNPGTLTGSPGFSGDVHFDDEEHWTVAGKEGKKLSCAKITEKHIDF